MNIFKIDAHDFYWLCDEEDDLCLHGAACAIIGERRLEYDCTVSATALYLLKTLTQDHIIYTDNQLLPCCGHFYIPDDDLQNVMISGCPNGIDWTVRHEGDSVVIELEDGYSVRVPLCEYRDEVFRFADMIEDHYSSRPPKNLPQDEFLRNGYIAFWNEWHRRRGDRAVSG